MEVYGSLEFSAYLTHGLDDVDAEAGETALSVARDRIIDILTSVGDQIEVRVTWISDGNQEEQF
jgi:hypothetical protein